MTAYLYVKTARCFHCGQEGVVSVPQEGYDLWKAGIHAQNALPFTPAEVREQLMTGTHPECWTEMFPEEED